MPGNKKIRRNQKIMRLTKEIMWDVNERGCHICTSHKPDAYGYPRIQVHHQQWKISRFVWTQYFGKIPVGLCVLHRCDTPACIRCDHLFLGTDADNMRDKEIKGRCSHCSPKGEQSGNAKLTNKHVLYIRSSPMSGSALARLFGVSQPIVSRIRSRQIWKHI